MESVQSKNDEVKSVGDNESKMIIEEIKPGSNIKPNSDEQNKQLKPLSEFNIKGGFFIAKKVSDFNKIIKGYNGKIKSLNMNSGEIISKISSDELSLKRCTKIAIDKIKIYITKLKKQNNFNE